jgi:predicted RNA-binding protein Jag
MSGHTQLAADRVREMMERIATAAGVEADVEISDDGDGLLAEYIGDDLGLLIGRHGQTIDAIQHLAYRIATPPGIASAAPRRCGRPPIRPPRPRWPSTGPCRWRR